ncbi:hypothetical protein GXW71_14180 [Roseomonas hellenica]|uniref:Uncharacterized protein n=1 Tax=Plastoroseomonas hellenica TaxID=2687306 RepID=A0ABS5EYZ4_9PROT|nr:hypothetical protein [Plastoroseomonas hellenica]MBR0665506.1 hypothetical protein [Plastoroseomonas hellenica]
MMSSDAKYRDRLDKLADELQRAREAQQRMPPGPARVRRARQLLALERQQDTVRRTLGMPPCRERAEQVAADELARAQAALADAARARMERRRLTPTRRLRRLLSWRRGRGRRSGARPAVGADAPSPGRRMMTRFILGWITITLIGMATYAGLVSEATWSLGTFVEIAEAPPVPASAD